MFDLQTRDPTRIVPATPRAREDRRVLAFWTLVALLLIPGALLTWPLPGLPLLVAGASMCVAGLGHLVLRRLQARRAHDQLAIIQTLLRDDPDPIWLSVTADQPALALNPAATDLGPSLEQVLSIWTARPAVLLANLRDAALAGHAARKVLHRPEGTRLIWAQCMGVQPALVWRIIPLPTDIAGARDTDTMGFPLVTLGAPGNPIRTNAAARMLSSGETFPEQAFSHFAAGQDIAPLALMLQDGLHRFVGVSATGQDGLRDVLLLPSRFAPSEDRNRAEDIPVALLHLNAEGQVTQSNHAARLLIGLDPGESVFFADLVEGWDVLFRIGWATRVLVWR